MAGMIGIHNFRGAELPAGFWSVSCHLKEKRKKDAAAQSSDEHDAAASFSMPENQSFGTG
jgi:hypothetical protein